MSTTPAHTPRPRRIGSLKLLWPFAKPHSLLAVGWLVFLAISSSATLILPIAARQMIDHGFRGSNLAAINVSFMSLFVVALVMAFATAARFYCITLLGERTLAALRAKLYAHIIGLDVSFFERNRVGELISRLGTDTEVVQALVGSGISVALRSAVMLIGATVTRSWVFPKCGATYCALPAPWNASANCFMKKPPSSIRRSRCPRRRGPRFHPDAARRL